MTWYPANPYENYDSERFLNDLIGWSERIRHRLEHAPISVSLEDLPAIIPLLDAHHHYAAAGERVQKAQTPTVELFFENLGYDFSDQMQEAVKIAICHAPRSFLATFSLFDIVHLLELLDESDRFVDDSQ